MVEENHCYYQPKRKPLIKSMYPNCYAQQTEFNDRIISLLSAVLSNKRNSMRPSFVEAALQKSKTLQRQFRPSSASRPTPKRYCCHNDKKVDGSCALFDVVLVVMVDRRSDNQERESSTQQAEAESTTLGEMIAMFGLNDGSGSDWKVTTVDCDSIQ
jgi:hypothetical protein